MLNYAKSCYSQNVGGRMGPEIPTENTYVTCSSDAELIGWFFVRVRYILPR